MRIAAGLFVMLLLTGSANAEFSVCNRSAHPIRVALGHFTGLSWGSEGWWFIDQGKCSRLIEQPLNARYYYLYATNELFNVWDGGKNFCVTIFKKFTIDGRGGCASRGYYQLGFFEIDTGNRLDWTQTVSDTN